MTGRPETFLLGLQRTDSNKFLFFFRLFSLGKSCIGKPYILEPPLDIDYVLYYPLYIKTKEHKTDHVVCCLLNCPQYIQIL